MTRRVLRVTVLLGCLGLLACASYPLRIFWENQVKAPVAPPSSEWRPEPALWPVRGIMYSWLGHATVLLRIDGVTMLTDPVLMERIGPPDWMDNALGIRRLTPLAISLDQIPEVDLTLISHAHYDHLDLPSLRFLGMRAPRMLTIVPWQTGYLLDEEGMRYREMHWNDMFQAFPGIALRAFEVEHYGNTPYTPRSRLMGYNGYLIEAAGKRIAFLGDTAWRRFRDSEGKVVPRPTPIDWAARVGPGLDLCILPIGDYFFEWNHMSPEEALAMATELKCRRVLPIHYDTFLLTPPSDMPEPPRARLEGVLARFPFLPRFSCLQAAIGVESFPEMGMTCVLD